MARSVLSRERIRWIGKGPTRARRTGLPKSAERADRRTRIYRRRDGDHMNRDQVEAVKLTLERIAQTDDGAMLIERFRTQCQADLDAQFLNIKRAADGGSEAAARFIIEQAAGRAKEGKEVTKTVVRLINDVFPAKKPRKKKKSRGK